MTDQALANDTSAALYASIVGALNEQSIQLDHDQVNQIVGAALNGITPLPLQALPNLPPEAATVINNVIEANTNAEAIREEITEAKEAMQGRQAELADQQEGAEITEELAAAKTGPGADAEPKSGTSNTSTPTPMPGDGG